MSHFSINTILHAQMQLMHGTLLKLTCLKNNMCVSVCKCVV